MKIVCKIMFIVLLVIVVGLDLTILPYTISHERLVPTVFFRSFVENCTLVTVLYTYLDSTLKTQEERPIKGVRASADAAKQYADSIGDELYRNSVGWCPPGLIEGSVFSGLVKAMNAVPLEKLGSSEVVLAYLKLRERFLNFGNVLGGFDGGAWCKAPLPDIAASEITKSVDAVKQAHCSLVAAITRSA